MCAMPSPSTFLEDAAPPALPLGTRARLGLGGAALGNLFVNRDDRRSKTELVVFLRPVVVREANLDMDYREYRDKLPGQNFFKGEHGPQRQEFNFGGSPQ